MSTRKNPSDRHTLPVPGRSNGRGCGDGQILSEAERSSAVVTGEIHDQQAARARGVVVRMRLESPTLKAASKIEGLERLPGFSNYFIGYLPK